jgi:hydrogenase expression/formation protein HypC
MCVSIPVQVVAVQPDGTAVVDGPAGRHRVALLDVEAGAGDWLLAHSGIALARIDADEAQARLALFSGPSGPRAGGGSRADRGSADR